MLGWMEAPTRQKRHNRYLLAAMVILAAVILLQRLRLYAAPLYGDICAYAVLGHEMMHGRRLYSDLWERKPPLLYVTYAAAECVTGYGRGEIFLLGVVCALLSLVFIYQIGQSNDRGRIAGLLSAGLWMLLNCDLDLTANQTDPEVFINLWLLAAFWLLLRWPPRRRMNWACLLGLFLCAATLYKHNTVIVCLALLAGHLIARRGRSIMDRFVESSVAGAILVGIWLAMYCYFAATDRAHVFIDVLFHQNLLYSGDVTKNLGTSTEFWRILPAFMIWAIAPGLLITVSVAFALRGSGTFPGRKPDWLLLLFWSLGTWPTVAFTGHLYPHYFQLWLPIGCIAGGWAAGALLEKSNRVPPMVAFATIAVAFAFLALREGGQFTLTPREWVHRQFPYFNLVAQNRLGTDLGKVLRPDEQFWEMGEDNALYFFSRKSPPTGLLFIDPYLFGDETAVYWKRLLRDLDQSKPALVVMSDNWTMFFPPNAPIYPWLQQSYVKWNTPLGWPHYQMLVRRGSGLEKRIGSDGENPALH